jgi:hypothetical protein
MLRSPRKITDGTRGSVSASTGTATNVLPEKRCEDLRLDTLHPDLCQPGSTVRVLKVARKVHGPLPNVNEEDRVQRLILVE